MAALIILIIVGAVILWFLLSFLFKSIGRTLAEKGEELKTTLTDEEVVRNKEKEREELRKWERKSDL